MAKQAARHAKDPRGHRVLYQANMPNTTPLDSLAKIFTMGEYTAVIIRASGSGECHIAFPESPGFEFSRKPFLLSQGQVDELLGIVNSLKDARNPKESEDAKIALFTKMIENRNELVTKTKTIEMKQAWINGDIPREKYKEWESMCDPKVRYTISRVINSKELHEKTKEFVKENIDVFDTILTDQDIANIKLASGIIHRSGKPLQVVPMSEEHNNVHVEIRAVHHALAMDSNNRVFDLGLANGDGKTVGCCQGCTKDFDELEKYGVIVRRTADFPDNPPRRRYKSFWDLPKLQDLSNALNKGVSHHNVVKDSWDSEVTQVGFQPLYEHKGSSLGEDAVGAPKGTVTGAANAAGSSWQPQIVEWTQDQSATSVPQSASSVVRPLQPQAAAESKDIATSQASVMSQEVKKEAKVIGGKLPSSHIEPINQRNKGNKGAKKDKGKDKDTTTIHSR